MHLEAPTLRDLGEYRRIFLDPDIGAWLRPPPLRPFGSGDVLALLERDVGLWRRDGWGPWIVRDEERNLVGRVGLDRTMVEGASVIELAWSVLPWRQGRGFASAAAREAVELAKQSQIRDLVALALPRNTASRRIMEKLGMTLVGEVTHAGLPHALYRLALTEPQLPRS